MTAIVGAVLGQVGFQASDRLISVQRRKLEPYSADYNKALVLVFDDALLIIGLAGLAYIGGTPTDRCIAQDVLGGPIDERGFTGKAPDLGSAYVALERCIAGINERLASEATDEPLTLLVTGIRAGRKKPNRGPVRRTEPVTWVASRRPTDGRLELSTGSTASPFNWSSSFAVHNAGQHDQPTTLSRIRDQLSKGPFAEPSDVAKALSDEVRSISQSIPTVGKDCIVISVELGRPEVPTISIWADPQHEGKQRDGDMVTGYTPWVIRSRDVWFSPATFGSRDGTGGWKTDGGMSIRTYSSLRAQGGDGRYDGQGGKRFSWSTRPQPRRPTR